MRKLGTLIAVILLINPWVSVLAQTATPVSGPFPAKSSTINGSDFGVLTFDGDLDKYGLITTFGIPDAPAFDWPFVVYNGTGKPLEDLRLKVYEMIDGKRHTFDDNAWVYPLVIQPGEFGFGGVSFDVDGVQLTTGPEDGLDAVFSGRPIDPAETADKYVDLTVVSAKSGSSGNVSGVIENRTKRDVKDIWVYRLCVEDSGIPTEYFSQPIDRRLLKAGTSADFKVSMDPCDGASFVTVNAEKT